MKGKGKGSLRGDGKGKRFKKTLGNVSKVCTRFVHSFFGSVPEAYQKLTRTSLKARVRGVKRPARRMRSLGALAMGAARVAVSVLVLVLVVVPRGWVAAGPGAPWAS